MKKSALFLAAALVSGASFADVQTVELTPVAPQAGGMGGSTTGALVVSGAVAAVAVGTALSIASDDSATPGDGNAPTTSTSTTNT